MCRWLRSLYLGGTKVDDAEILITRCPLTTLQVLQYLFSAVQIIIYIFLSGSARHLADYRSIGIYVRLRPVMTPSMNTSLD